MENEELLDINRGGQPEGKAFGIAGFVLSLVGFLFSIFTMGISMVQVIAGGSGILSYVWVFVSLLSVALSVVGMVKLGKSGGNKGLSIAGLVIGIVATLVSILLLVLVIRAGEAMRDVTEQMENSEEFRELFEDNEEFKELMDELNDN